VLWSLFGVPVSMVTKMDHGYRSNGLGVVVRIGGAINTATVVIVCMHFRLLSQGRELVEAGAAALLSADVGEPDLTVDQFNAGSDLNALGMP
jgi:hypothetical protein